MSAQQPPIDIERVRAALAGAAIGHTLEHHASLPSTMDIARGWAANARIRSGALVLAEEQTLGRGRLQRTWQAASGTSLLLSLLLRREQLPHNPAHLPMVAGLALVDAVARLAPNLAVGLKWPNDLLVGDDPAGAGKAAGILVEAIVTGSQVEAAIVGIGINVNQQRDDLPQVEPPARTPTSLALELGAPLDRTTLLISLCRALAAHLLEPEATLVARWRSHLWTLGRPVSAHNPDGSTLDGLAVDVTPAGELVIETADGRRHPLLAGDVSLRGS